MANLWQTILDTQWAWTTLAWLLLIGSITLFLWAIFRDRPGFWGIPRERCPKCRYDMAGRQAVEPEAAIQCPECGKRIKHASMLQKTRRRWGMACLTLPLLLGLYLTTQKNLIRYRGWISVAPTVGIAAFIDPDDWYQQSVLDHQIRGPKGQTSLAMYFHGRLLTGPPWAMDLWMWRARGVIAREGWVVRDVDDVAPVVVYRRSSKSRKSPFSLLFTPVIAEDYETRDLADLIIDSIDRDKWIPMGGETHRGIRNAGDHLLVDATEPMLGWIDELLELLRTAHANPTGAHHARINGRYFFACSLKKFDQTNWYVSILEHNEERERISLNSSGFGCSHSQDPWSVGPQYHGDQYGEWLTDRDVRNRVETAVAAITGHENWISWGGEGMDGRTINGIFIIYSDSDHAVEIMAALDRIQTIGPEAVLAEHGITPN